MLCAIRIGFLKYIFCLIHVSLHFTSCFNTQHLENIHDLSNREFYDQNLKVKPSGDSVHAKVSEILKFVDLKNGGSVKTLLDALLFVESGKNQESINSVDGDFPQLENWEFPLVTTTNVLDVVEEKLQRIDAYALDEIRNFMTSTSEAATSETLLESNKPATDEAQCYQDTNTIFDPIAGKLVALVGKQVCERFNSPILQNMCFDLTSRKQNYTLPAGALPMIDAAGKIPPGLTEGKLAWVGAYELCEKKVDVTYNYSANSTPNAFQGKYCRIKLGFQKTSAIHLTYGVCMPSSCDSKSVENYITKENIILSIIFNFVLNWTIAEVYCGQETIHASTDGSLITSMTILVSTVLFIVACTIYDWFFRSRIIEKKFAILKPVSKYSLKKTATEDWSLQKITIKQRLELAIVSFSLYTNWSKLFNTNRKPEQIRCLDGFRFCSFIYLILGQTYLFGPIYTESWITANMLVAVPNIIQKLYMQPIINYNLCEDSFLVISGILITYWVLHKYEIKGQKFSFKSAIQFIVHRYIRLMPSLAFGLMVYTCTYRYVANGPLYPSSITDADNCRYNWWTVVFMVHNLVDVHNMCFGHIWATSMLFQLHVVSLLVVIALVIKKRIGYVLLLVLYVAHIICVSLISNSIRSEGPRGLERWYYEYLMTPWCRAGPFIVGLACGILIKNNVNIFVHWSIGALGWIISIVTILLVSCSSWMQFKEGGTLWTQSQHVAYDTLARSAWGVACSFIIYACHLGYGGGANKFLGYRVFRPLSRLVYPSLIISAMTIYTWGYTLRYPMYVDTFNMLYISFGHICMCLMYGTMASLGWQLPFAVNLERTYLYTTVQQWIHAASHPHELCTPECALRHRDSLLNGGMHNITQDLEFFDDTIYKTKISKEPIRTYQNDVIRNPAIQLDGVNDIKANQTNNESKVEYSLEDKNSGPINTQGSSAQANLAFLLDDMNSRVQNGEQLNARLRSFEKKMADNINSHVILKNPKWPLMSGMSVESDRIDLLDEDNSNNNSTINTPAIIETLPNFKLN